MDTGIKRFTAQPLEYFSDLQMKDIHSASLDILEDCGTVVHHEEAVQLLKGAGAWVQDGNRVFIPTVGGVGGPGRHHRGSGSGPESTLSIISTPLIGFLLI